MSILEGLRERRTVYQLNKELPIPAAEVRQLIEETTELVPDAFNMKSARVVVAFGEKQDALWDDVYEAFGGIAAQPEPKEKEDIAQRVRWEAGDAAGFVVFS